MHDPRPTFRRMHEHLWHGDLDAAFALGEWLLDQEPDAECYELLIRLLDHHVTRESRSHLLHLLRLLEREPDGARPIWRRYLRVVILARLPCKEEAFAHSAELVDVPARYGWMRYERAHLLLSRLWAYDEALRELEAVIATTPRFWKAAGTLAEVELCRGRERAAFSIFDACVDRLRTEGSEIDRAHSAVWRAELRLWMGHYGQVIEDLREPSERQLPLALGWRGAAYLLLGEPAAARAHLDQVLLIDPSDTEAIVWHGETLAALGEWEAALGDFDHAAHMQQPALWPVLGRALVRAHLGDAAGFFADCDLLARDEVGLLRAAAGAVTGGDLDTSAAWLRAVRTGARGVRRPEGWLRPVWLRPGAWRETGPFESVERASGRAGERASGRAGEDTAAVGDQHASVSLPTLFDLTAGHRLTLKAVGEVLVEHIREESPGMFEITASAPGARPLVMILSTAPTRLFLCRTARGHYLSYRGSDPTRAEVGAVEDAAKYL